MSLYVSRRLHLMGSVVDRSNLASYRPHSALRHQLRIRQGSGALCLGEPDPATGAAIGKASQDVKMMVIDRNGDHIDSPLVQGLRENRTGDFPGRG